MVRRDCVCRGEDATRRAFCTGRRGGDAAQKRNIIAAGRAYLAHNHLLGSPYSYDIITVVGKQRPFCITHLRHAYNEETVWKQRLHKRDFEV